MDAGDPAGIAALRGQRHEAGLGLRLALADGGGDICHPPERVRPRPSAAIWPRAQRHGSGDRGDGGHRGDRPDRGQGALFTLGALPASALGDRAEVGTGLLLAFVMAGLPAYYAEVGQARLPVPSTSLLLQGRKTWMPGT